eukprot:624699-Amphidinium_carterae.1
MRHSRFYISAGVWVSSFRGTCEVAICQPLPPCFKERLLGVCHLPIQHVCARCSLSALHVGSANLLESLVLIDTMPEVYYCLN